MLPFPKAKDRKHEQSNKKVRVIAMVTELTLRLLTFVRVKLKIILIPRVIIYSGKSIIIQVVSSHALKDELYFLSILNSLSVSANLRCHIFPYFGLRGKKEEGKTKADNISKYISGKGRDKYEWRLKEHSLIYLNVKY